MARGRSKSRQVCQVSQACPGFCAEGVSNRLTRCRGLQRPSTACCRTARRCRVQLGFGLAPGPGPSPGPEPSPWPGAWAAAAAAVAAGSPRPLLW